MVKFNAMKTKPLRLLRQKRASWLKSVFVLTCLLLSTSVAMAQTKTVTGTVTDSFNEPLIGASILVKGTSTGAVTDMDGKYSISVTPNDVLVFSYVGYEKQEIKVGQQTVINVTLKDDSQMLAETVIIGYGSAKKRDLTGSITNIKGSEIANKPATNPLSSLQGKIAGVQIVNSGQAGADPEIRIRGTNSINGYKPLYVVDGLFNDNINFLNPEDIESMEVLKDPSSLAIFGVRGANGVIIVTTKRAKEGQTLVNINTSFGWKSVVDKIKMVNAPQFKELYNEQMANQGNALFDFSNWNANTDWQDEIFQTGFITNNNVSITGASEKHSFYLGVGYSHEQGNIKHEKYSKVTINASNDYKITKDIKVGFQFNGARMLPADSKTVLNAIRTTPVAPVYNEEYGLYTSLPEFQKAQMNNPMVDVNLRANLRFNPTDNINLRLSYSSGFRAPQAFDEDMHIENVGGTVAMIERAKDLKEEKSQSFSASADMYHRFGAFQTNLLVEGFYTRLTDVFVLGGPFDRGDGVLVKIRSNGPGAKVMGLTLEGKIAYLSLLQIQAGLTLQRSRYDEPHKWHDDAPAERKIFRTPDIYGYFTATYTPVKPLSIALSGTYTGSMLVQRMDISAENVAMGDMPERKAEAIRTPRFFDMGVKIAYDFKLYKTVDLQLSGGVQNIFEAYQKDFDRGANRDSNYIYGPSLPRSFFAGVKISY